MCEDVAVVESAAPGPSIFDDDNVDVDVDVDGVVDVDVDVDGDVDGVDFSGRNVMNSTATVDDSDGLFAPTTGEVVKTGSSVFE